MTTAYVDPESFMTPPLASRIALVTGASRGIGYATARALAKAGAHVVAVARTQAGLEELDDDIRKQGGSATLVPLDLTDFDGIARLGAAKARASIPLQKSLAKKMDGRVKPGHDGSVFGTVPALRSGMPGDASHRLRMPHRVRDTRRGGAARAPE